MKLTSTALFGLSALFMSACSTSGLDARSSFKCTEENGFEGCTSISQTYKGSINNPNVNRNSNGVGDSYSRQVPYSGMPIRTQIKVLRIWMAPWEDKLGVLHDQSFMYIPLNESRWQIEHNQEAIIDEYRPQVQLLGSVGANKANDDQMPDLGLTPKNNGIDRTQDPLAAPPNLLPSPNVK
mgnify:CR=1 FL=1